MKLYSFEKLDTWKEARILVKWIYEVTATFPSEERFGLVNQVRRAAVSVMANLAEGCSRRSAKDQAHFSQLAYSSLLEVLSHMIVSADLGFLDEGKAAVARSLIESITYKINSLRNSQVARISKS
jgi:four helix bundle protein